MTLVLNMDLDNLTKVTNYGFDRKKFPHTFYFRLYENGYAVDMSKFTRLTLRIRVDSTNAIDTVNITKVVTINGEKLIEVNLDEKYSTKNDKLFITPTVRISNKSIILKEFQFIIHEGSKTEMSMVKHGLERFNHLYNLYIKAIKRDQINKPNGVIGLDSDGRMSIDILPDAVGQHVQTKIRDSEIHGIRMNDKFMLEVYDADDEYWWEANVLHGGFFTHKNKPEQYNVFGGLWGELETPTETDAGGFDDVIDEAFDAGTFKDESTLSPIHAGKF